ncbi:MAG: hypothetical protein ABIG44_11525 [Planctomycetota bacterium]
MSLMYRRRPILKWSATIAAVVALALTVLSFWLDFMVWTPRLRVGVCLGVVRVVRVDGLRTLSYDTLLAVEVSRAGPWSVNNDPGWSTLPTYKWLQNGWRLDVPVWPFIVLPGVLAGWIWWRERHRPGPGCCEHCGYNLTGNLSGRCSECGESVSKVRS